MSRSLFILASVLLLCSMLAFGMMLAPNHNQPGLPANGTLWKTASMFLLVGALLSAFCGVLTAMFEQVDRRTQERRRLEESSNCGWPCAPAPATAPPTNATALSRPASPAAPAKAATIEAGRVSHGSGLRVS